MPPDFYFRGTLAQYWKAIYAEYTRLTTILGNEPFSLAVSDGLTFSLSEYEPAIMDAVIIQFADREYGDFDTDLKTAHPIPLKFYGDCIVSVKADTVLGAELVNLDVTVYVDALKKSNGSVYVRWLKIQNAWLEKGLLINPVISIAEMPQLVAKPGQLPQPENGADLTLFFDRYHQKKKGRKYLLRQIAEDTGFGYGYVRQRHSKYLKEQGLAKPEKRTNKRTNEQKLTLIPSLLHYHIFQDEQSWIFCFRNLEVRFLFFAKRQEFLNREAR